MVSEYINIITTIFLIYIKLLHSMDTQKIETKKSRQLKKLLFNFLQICNLKKACSRKMKGDIGLRRRIFDGDYNKSYFFLLRL